MTEPTNYFSTASDDYLTFRPRYPEEFFDYLVDIAPSNAHAWDCGCGNGQASVALASRFKRVSATDLSATQIAQAQARNNIAYQVGRAEVIEARDNSLDLITAAQAIHWFDHQRFFAEVNRCLRPGGVLAAWGYQLLYTGTAMDRCIEIFHDEIVGPYWPAGRELLDDGYAGITFPYPRETAPTFFMHNEWSFAHLIGYLNTWSAVKRYREVLGRNPVEEYLAQLRKAWGNEQQLRPVHWPLILYLGKKPV
ncbi:MAG: class I SAM-dependent methyltransferase [Cellvibrionaceae bacterium]